MERLFVLKLFGLIVTKLTGFFKRHVKSTTDTSGTGTRNAIPVNLPFRSGITFPTAFAAPVDAGMMFWKAPLPSRHFCNENKNISHLTARKLFIMERDGR